MVKVKFDVQRFSNVIHGTASGDYGSNIADNTQVYGLAGNDTIETNGSKNVILIGGSGNDVIHMTGGSGTLNGGAGSDTFKLTYSGANTLSAVIEDIAPTTDKLIIDYAGTETPKINYSTVGKDIVLTDDNGYFNVTLKGYREANDYFDGTANENVWEVFKIVNQEREAEGLNWLTLSQGLIDATSIRAEELVESFSHTRPDGTSCFTASEKSYSGMGENIAAGYSSPEDVMVGWMNSAGHRANILNEDYKKIGVGYYYKSGSYYGNHWVQMFGGTLDETETVSVANLLGTAVTISANGVTKSTSTLGNISNLKRTTISGTASADLLVNGRWYGEKATQNVEILGLSGNDTISNSGSNSVLDGGAGNDEIHNGYYYYDNGWTGFLEESYNGDYDDENGSSNVTINGGDGDDEIYNLGENAVYVYNSGDGADTIFGYNSGDTIKISGAKYSTQTSGSNVIVSVTGSGTIKLVGASDKTLNIVGTLEGGGTSTSKIINGTSGSDNLTNTVAGATINALGGNDLISNTSLASAAVIYGGTGNDNIFNYADSVTIDGGEGNDGVTNSGDWTTIDMGDGDDNIDNSGYSVNIHAGSGDNRIVNNGDGTSMYTGAGDDYVDNNGDSVKISLGAGNDSVWNKGDVVTILGGAGNDSINNYGKEVTINAGAGDDKIILAINNSQVLIYNSGDGADTISGYRSSDTISITGGAYTKSTVGDDVIISVGSGSMRLIQASDKTLNIVGTLEGSSGVTLSNSTKNTIISGTNYADSIYNSSANVTINSSAGDDVINNVGNNVLINAGAGNDSTWGGGNGVTINGGAGNDRLELWGINSVINTDDGNNEVFIHGNNVTVNGGTGKDSVEIWDDYGGYPPKAVGKAKISTGADNDFVKNYGAGATINTGAGNDTIQIISGYTYNGTRANVYQYAQGDGNDTILGYNSGDSIQITRGSYTTMTSGNDVIISVGSGKILLKDSKNTTLNIDGDAETTLPAGISIKSATLTASTAFTGSKIDLADYATNVTKVNASALSRSVSIVGTAAANSLKGGKGADTIYGGAGNDTVSLGGGADIYIYSGGNDLIQDYVAGTDKIKLASASITGSSLSGKNVILKTSAGNINVKNGKNKKITVIDSRGAETSNVYPLETLPAGLSYDSAKKTLTVGTSYGGAAIDLANFATTTKTVDASAYSKKIQITGNNLGNTIRGGKGNDTLSGGSKADTIYGGAGIDKIYGGAGADKLFGDAGNDTLYGGAGNDTLTGGDGKDVFVYGSGEGKDVIADYTAGTDKIKISSGAITATGYKSNDVVFTVGSGNLTVKNGKGKKITIVDAAGRTSTKTYTAGVSYGRNGNAAVPWFTADDANFISSEANLDAISAEKYSVTNFSATNFENIFAQEIQPVYSTDKTK